VHSGVTKLKPPSSERCRQVVKKYGLDSPFVYYPAMLAPHKNHETAVQAVRLLITQYDTQLSLVLTGDKPLGRKQVFEEYLEQLGMSGYVRHLGFVPREDVPCLMSLSKALVFPSRFEGFGLPILEAMQLGTPVLASRVGSIPEIAGGGAWLLDPDDPANWCEALVSVLRGGRKLRNRIAVGYEHVQGFSWEKCAVQTAAVFKEAMYTR
jgi:glycosyltransferase involved in cell wall biosynthesis